MTIEVTAHDWDINVQHRKIESDPTEAWFGYEIAWKRIEAALLQQFGDYKGLKVIEIGCGLGLTGLHFARQGASVTLLDYSPETLKKAQLFWQQQGVAFQELIQADIFKINDELLNQFDVCLSWGLIEHFPDLQRRKAAVKAHADLVRPGGMVLIETPHKFGLMYRFWDVLTRLLINRKEKTVLYDHEWPYSKSEYRQMLTALDCMDSYQFVGGNFIGTINKYLLAKVRIVFLNLWHFHSLRRPREKNYPEKPQFFGLFLKPRYSVLDDVIGSGLHFIAIKK